MIQALSLFFLFLHIVAIAMAMGVTIANFVAFKQFWKLYDVNKEQGLAAFRAISNSQLIGIIGLLLLILSGIGMLAMVQWVFVNLLWFQIKLVLILLIFVNGFTMGRTSTLKLQAFLSAENKTGELGSETTLRRIANLSNQSTHTIHPYYYSKCFQVYDYIIPSENKALMA